ncbi:MAG TPA: WXG100 family type VII secretion target [Clostridiaceae bacterium]|nr:WXG100 family type VII secretion target [Clostridiaceae bacterium]
MANKLKIDFDQLNDTIKDYEKSIDEFETLVNTLTASVDALKNSGWKSAASDAFFKTFDETWKKNIEMHIKILIHLKECLNYAKTEYETLYNSIPSIGNSL